MKMTFNFKINHVRTAPPAVSTTANANLKDREYHSIGSVLKDMSPQQRARLAFVAGLRHGLRDMGLTRRGLPPTLPQRFKDFGTAQVFALGLAALVTSAASWALGPGGYSGLEFTLPQREAGIALAAPALEKVGFILHGVYKVPDKFAQGSVSLRLILGAALATPNILADVIFHDSAYAPLTYGGLMVEGMPVWCVSGAAFTTALVFATVAQHAVVSGVRALNRF